ncbi:G1/S-specific cyclin-E [Drosophila hydei]|uniref:G1/S-specific cyclin-E n=1 Tax=Drosophila hydei TaxID=7224 RepID=A0A6J1LIL7_DROHY|nr:G1/S-specific cyclin-E [Drosophila hydei]XP_023166266.2 G1/S-specific cyclin-E [Drosophila hydei]
MDLYAKSANTTSSSSSSNSNSNEKQEHVVTPASSSGAAASASASASLCLLYQIASVGKARATTTLATTTTTTTTTSTDDSLYLLSQFQDKPQRISKVHSAFGNFVGGKRKRKRNSFLPEDPELGCEPPSAKRQQRLADVSTACCRNQDSKKSAVSAGPVYTSPVASTTTSETATQELLSLRSLPAAELPKQPPHSPLPDSPDSPPSPDRGAKQQPVVVRYASEDIVAHQDEMLDDSYEESFFDEDPEDEDDDDDDDADADDAIGDINSSSSSPASSTATGCSQNGERTPATQHVPAAQHPNDGSSRNNALRKFNGLDESSAYANYKCLSPAAEIPLRQCPLPSLSWANAAEVWKRMCLRDEQDSHLRSSSMLEHHPGLQPRMRAILLDWLIEVCEVYKLHRETFYLAVDYLDRYLHVARQVQKTHLQLFGITCLFVAAKVEEIYPPKICEFAYVTDGACTERDILQHEKLLLQAINWDICPITATAWLGVYMQLNVSNRTPAAFSQIGRQARSTTQAGAASTCDDAFIYPQFSAYEFVQTSQLLDLCTLDVGMANYPYSILAAAAMSHTFSRETALRSSGLDWEAIQPCARWMEPFFHVISKRAPYLMLNEQNEQVTNKFGLGHICNSIVTDDSHIIQTHTTTMDMYDELLMAQNALHEMRTRTQASPATALRAPVSLLTPPASSHKPDLDINEDEEEEPQKKQHVAAAASNTNINSSSSSSSSSTRAPLTPIYPAHPGSSGA